MSEWISKHLLSDALVAVRTLDEPFSDAILRTLLQNTSDAVLVTDLEHRSVACNDRFARFFRVEAKAVVEMGVEELRAVVIPRLADPESWIRQLDEIYSEPDLTYRDEMSLVGDHPMVLLRTTGPIRMSDGTIVGRLWKFRNITQDRYRERLRQVIFEVSTLNHPDPAHILKQVVAKVAEAYQSVAILSIRRGNTMHFRETAGVPPDVPDIRKNPVKQAYCQVTMRQDKPLLVDDGANDPRFKSIGPVRMGFTRYLGATIRDGNGRPIGTICMLGTHNSQPLTDDDSQFISMMAIRIQTEIEREHIYQQRTADQRAMLRRQQEELATTHSVLKAMNDGFTLLGSDHSTEQFVSIQLRLLKGILGYSAAAIMFDDGDDFFGRFVGPGLEDSQVMPAKPERWDSLTEKASVKTFVEAPAALRDLLGVRSIVSAAMPIAPDEQGLLILGTNAHRDPRDEHHRVHLEALIDQVTLLMAAHRLNQRLAAAVDELRATQAQLVQGEKLSVVGTLAASVAHDIRNIMTSLKLECALGASTPAATLAKVGAQLERFSLLAHRLLSYAKPTMLSREATNFNVLLERAADMVEPQMRVTNVKLIWDLDAACPGIDADPNQVEHLFVNLILNAIQSMHEQGGTLTLRTREDKDGIYAEVADTGNGIQPERITELFEPFRTTRANGFGLGLYSCGRIAAEHSWQIHVESKMGKGTVFQVQVPLDK